MTISAIEQAEIVDITIIRGDSFNRTILVENADGTPAKLSGFSAVAQVFDEESDEVKADFTIPDLQDDGLIPLVLKVADTTDLDVGTLSWALTVLGKGNEEVSTTTILVGDAEVKSRRGGV